MSRLTIAQFEDILTEQLEWSSSVAIRQQTLYEMI